MTNFPFRLLCLFMFPVSSCENTNTWTVKPAINKVDSQSTVTQTKNPPKDTSNKKPIDYKLIAFVGEKIEVKSLPARPGSMDAKFGAKYKVLQQVYGNISLDTIEFTAYDHYGWPDFAKYKNALLFVVEGEGKYYHEKYMYSAVYKVKNGKWAGPYQQEDYGHIYNKKTPIKPVIIDWVQKPVYPIKGRMPDGAEYKISYPRPYFRRKGDSAVAVYGNYLEDLFALKKNGFLKARKWFTPTQEELDWSYDLDPEEIGPEPKDAASKKFRAFWKTFAASVKEPGLQQFRQLALDSLVICSKTFETGSFIDKCLHEIFNKELTKRLADRKRVKYDVQDADYTYLNTQAQQQIIKTNGEYVFRQVAVNRNPEGDDPPTVYFDFIETKKGYRLYAIGHYWHKECCQ